MPRVTCRSLPLVPLLVVAACTCAPARGRADDWPQWLGPRRDGVWRETGLVERFPAGGPKVVWRTPLGAGYSGPAIAGDRVYVLDRQRAHDAEGKPKPPTRDGIPGRLRRHVAVYVDEPAVMAAAIAAARVG